MYWKVQGKKGKVITVKRKVVVCMLVAATPTYGEGPFFFSGVFEHGLGPDWAFDNPTVMVW